MNKLVKENIDLVSEILNDHDLLNVFVDSLKIETKEEKNLECIIKKMRRLYDDSF